MLSKKSKRAIHIGFFIWLLFFAITFVTNGYEFSKVSVDCPAYLTLDCSNPFYYNPNGLNEPGLKEFCEKNIELCEPATIKPGQYLGEKPNVLMAYFNHFSIFILLITLIFAYLGGKNGKNNN